MEQLQNLLIHLEIKIENLLQQALLIAMFNVDEWNKIDSGQIIKEMVLKI
jgi:hypothetical protein